MSDAASQLLRFERTKATMEQLTQELADQFVWSPASGDTLEAVRAEAQARGFEVAELKYSEDGTAIEMQLQPLRWIFNTVVIK